MPELQAGVLHRNAKSLVGTMKYFQAPQPDKIKQSITLQYKSGTSKIKNIIQKSSTSWLTITGSAQN